MVRGWDTPQKVKERSDFHEIVQQLLFSSCFLSNKNRRVIWTSCRNDVSSLKLLLHKLAQMLQLLPRNRPLVQPHRTTCCPGEGWDMLLGSGPYDKFVPNMRLAKAVSSPQSNGMRVCKGSWWQCFSNISRVVMLSICLSRAAFNLTRNLIKGSSTPCLILTNEVVVRPTSSTLRKNCKNTSFDCR